MHPSEQTRVFQRIQYKTHADCSGSDLTGLQLLAGGQQRLDHGGGDQLGHGVCRETLSFDEGLSLPEALRLVRQQQLLQNRARFLPADLTEGALQLLDGTDGQNTLRPAVLTPACAVCAGPAGTLESWWRLRTCLQ